MYQEYFCHHLFVSDGLVFGLVWAKIRLAQQAPIYNIEVLNHLFLS